MEEKINGCAPPWAEPGRFFCALAPALLVCFRFEFGKLVDKIYFCGLDKIRIVWYKYAQNPIQEVTNGSTGACSKAERLRGI
jgi:hypothetical protein